MTLWAGLRIFAGIVLDNIFPGLLQTSPAWLAEVGGGAWSSPLTKSPATS